MKAVPEKAPTTPTRTDTVSCTDRPPAPPSRAPSPDRRSLQRLQRAAGNRAVSRLVAQRYTAPVKPSPAQAPGFRAVKADVAAKRTRIAVHPPAAAESKASQDAAVAPPDDKEAQGKAANAEKMNAAKPGEFDKKAFVDAVNKAIDAQAPKNLDEADKFSKSGKADKVKDEVDGKVTDGKESSAKDIDTATKAPPDTSAAKDKEVTPLTPDQPPANPGAPSASDAIPAKQPASVTDFSEGPAANDQAMADAEITEEQLAKGNEPEFDEALSAKKTAETDSAKAPAKSQAAENQQLSSAKEGAAASGAQAMTALTATRASAGKQVDGGKGDTKSKDEKKRTEVTAKLQKVYDGTKKDVEETLSGLDKKVDAAFTSGEKAARDAFTADHKRRMKKYKDKRYSGWTGKARWVKDKFAGLPKEANNLYQEARKLYVSQMQTVISAIADLIGTELGKAKARIAKGRTELKAEVDKLPADLKQFGEEAAKDFAGKFEDLEATVNEKSEQLVQDLANKYTAALNKIDEEIKKLQEANKGLIDKAMDAIVGVAKTINELKNLLFGILAKAGSAIMKILKDPIGFLGNLVKAVGAGLNLFLTNIAEHLKTGVVSWLLGTAVKAGLELPAKFDLKGIIQLIGSLLGLTWDNIRARVTRKGVPEEAMTAVETSVPVAKNLAREGPAGAVKEIQAEAGDLKATILEKLTSYLIPTVIIAGITWILSLLNPASAFIRAVKGIIDIVTFIVTQGAQIADFVNAVLDAVIAIANGGAAGVPKLVEAALATSIPLLIGFLASLLGIGGLANKVKSVFHAVSRPVNRAIDKIVDFIAKKGKALWSKLKEKSGGDDGKTSKTSPDDGKNKDRNTSNHPKKRDESREQPLRLPKKSFTSKDGEGHTLAFSGNKPRAKLMMHSAPRPVGKFLDDWHAAIEASDEPRKREVQSKAHKEADESFEEVKGAQIALDNSTGVARQSNLSDLIDQLESLARCLAMYDPSLGEPIPAPVLPPFVNYVRAVKFTGHYINKTLTGTPSPSHKGKLRGWDHVENVGLNKGKNNTAWVKMHLLPDFLGGHATDSNLVPARGFTNNPLFFTSAENPAKKELDNNSEKIIWYRINELTFHTSPDGRFPDDAFPNTIAVEWGGYEWKQGAWHPKDASGSFSDDQDVPTIIRLRINKEGAKEIRQWLALPDNKGNRKIAREIKKGRPYSGITDLTMRFPDHANMFTKLESHGLIRWDL
ncbi:hypothetical protein OHA98_00005 [Streptomyces sp. NBC_00654]|uniref:phage tail protein n=1 Tax=Streptomyces sp. NBC_00654 TaxID=2975799 RepID=UPI002254671F|nr:hypothetical protein [Streptomyces sp. NBC_00654]MCX4963220.1 hypothetical protein [Streptomyces sp. NBC_00654]